MGELHDHRGKEPASDVPSSRRGDRRHDRAVRVQPQRERGAPPDATRLLDGRLDKLANVAEAEWPGVAVQRGAALQLSEPAQPGVPHRWRPQRV